PNASAAGPTVRLIDDAVRVLRDRPAPPRESILARDGGVAKLAALREETVAFQVLVQAGDEEGRELTVEVEGLAAGPSPLVVERFLEHHVRVASRSNHARRPLESLGWSPPARPDDRNVIGLLPDALVPIGLATTWIPYPLEVAPREASLVW